jgi:hypothetical protein
VGLAMMFASLPKISGGTGKKDLYKWSEIKTCLSQKDNFLSGFFSIDVSEQLKNADTSGKKGKGSIFFPARRQIRNNIYAFFYSIQSKKLSQKDFQELYIFYSEFFQKFTYTTIDLYFYDFCKKNISDFYPSQKSEKK